MLRRFCPDDAESALEEYLLEYERAHDACPRPFPGMREALALLRERGVALAVVTGKGPRSARISLDRFGLGDFFPIVEAGSPAGGVKPRCMRDVLARWQLPPSEVAGIGDSPTDLRSARAVGIGSVAAAWAPGADAERLARCQPDRLFRAVSGLRRWLEGAAPPLTR